MSVVACGDTPEVLEAAEHALDRVAVTVEDRRETVFPAPVGPRRDVGHRAVLLDLPANGVAVVALVAMQDDASGRHLLQQDRSGGAISDLPAGEQEGDGPTVAIGQRVDLGRATAARAADGLAGDCQDFRVWAAIVEPMEVPDGTTQSSPHSRRAA